MKQNKLLMLIAALLVAIMLVPSVSFAADATTAPTLKINKATYEDDLKGSIRYDDVDLTEEIVVTPTGLPKGSTAYLEWRSTQESVVHAYGSSSIQTPEEGDPSATTFAGPWVVPCQPCDNNPVTIKGDLYVTDKDGKKKTYKGAVSFDATYKLVPEGKMKFLQDKYEFTYEQIFGGSSGGIEILKDIENPTNPQKFYDELVYVDEKEEAVDSTYGKDDVTWVIEDTLYGTVDKGAMVNNYGNVRFFKSGSYTLKAYPRGGGDPAVTTISIAEKVPGEPEPEPETPIETGFTFLKFKAETITYTIIPDVVYYDDEYDGPMSIDDMEYLGPQLNEHRLYEFLNVEGDYGQYFNDSLIWTIEKNPDVAVLKNGIIHPLKVGEVEVKVRSKMFPDIYDTVTVKFVKAEEEEPEEEEVKPYDVFEFEKDEPTMLALDMLDLWTYLKVSPLPYYGEGNRIPGVIFTSSDPTVARFDGPYGMLLSYNAGDVTITATTGYGENRQTTSITVHVVEHTEPVVEYQEYEKLEFDIDEYTLYVNSNYDYVDLWDYLSIYPAKWEGLETIYFTSSDPLIASVEDDGWVYAIQASDTPVTITATTKHSQLSDTIQIIVKEKAEGDPKPFEKVEFALDELVLYPVEYDEDGDIDNPYYCIADLSKYMTVMPRDNWDDWIIFTSDNPSVVNLSYDGDIIALKASDKPVTITAKSALGDQSDTIKIIVKEPTEDLPVPFEDVKFLEDELTLYVNTPFAIADLWYYLKVSGSDEDDIIFTSDDPDVAYVKCMGYRSGIVVGLTPSDDPVTITAHSRYGDKKDTIKVYVKRETEAPVPFEDVKFSVDELTLYSYYTSPGVLNYYNSAELDEFLNTVGGRYDELVFTSDDPAVADVDVNGFVCAYEEGTATITAASKYGDKSDTITITVKAASELHVPFETVEFTVDELTLYSWYFDTEYCREIDVSDYLAYDNWSAINDDIIITSSDPMVVWVMDDGHTLRGWKEGEATITATSKYGTASDTLKVTVKYPPNAWEVFTKFEAVVPELTVYVQDGEFDLKQYLATIPEYWGELTESVVWSSSDDSVLRVNALTGAAVPVKASETPVTVTAKTAVTEQTATIKVTVLQEKRIPYVEINFLVPEMTVYEGDDDINIWPLLSVEGQTIDDGIILTSSDETVLKVSTIYDGTWGDVEIIKPGTAVITATSYLDRTKSATLTVTVKEVEWKTFDSINFVPDKFTVKKSAGTFDPIPYIVFQPDIRDVDFTGLVWASSDPTVAKVDRETGFVTIQDFRDEKATVTISVRTYADVKMTKTKSFELTIVNDDEYFKSLTFVDSKAYTAKFVEDGTFTSLLYLVQDPLPTKQHDDIFVDEIIWSSSDLETAWVDPMGVVHFLKPGTVKITARSKYNEKVLDSFTLTIAKNENPITSIDIIQDSIDLTMEADDRLITEYLEDYLIIKPVDYTNDELIWTSSDPAIVSISRSGRVKRNMPGTAKLTVRSKVNAVSKSFNVTVTKDPLISIKFIDEVPTELRKSQESINLIKYVVTEPYYYTGHEFADELVWTSDNPQYASVDDKGKVTYVNPGATVTITVCDKDGKAKPATIKLTTTDVWVTDISFVKSSMDMLVGDELAINNIDYVITPVNADEDYKDSIEWSTSDPDIVDIAFDFEVGYKLKAVGAGTATISAHMVNAYNEVTGSFTVNVAENGIKKITFAKKAYTKKISTNSDNIIRLYFTVSPYKAYFDPEKLSDALTIESSNRSVVDIKQRSLSKYVDVEKSYGYSESKGMYYVDVKCDAPGTAKITIASKENEKVKAKTKVVAEGVAVKKVKMPKKSMKLYYYYNPDQEFAYQNFYKIQPKIQPSNAWYNVTWETSNAGVAFVTDNLENGEKGIWIVATGAGTATITMNVDDGTTVHQAKMKVTVLSKTVDLKLNKKKATIKMIKGKKNTLQLEAFDSETEYDIPVKWTSSNKKVATVDKNGLVTAKKAGKAVITATTKDGNKTTATCNITVEKKKVTKLSAKGSISLARKTTAQLKVKVKPTDAYDTSLSYKSSDESIVTVDSDGLLTGVAAGEATITVKTKDGSKLTVVIDVTVTK